MKRSYCDSTSELAVAITRIYKKSRSSSSREVTATENKLKGAVSCTFTDEKMDMLREHAGVTTNLGRLLYNEGDLVTAMCLYQEALQSLHCLEKVTTSKNFALAYPFMLTVSTPERHEEMVQLLSILSSKADTPEARKTYTAAVRKLFFAGGKQDFFPKHHDNVVSLSVAGGVATDSFPCLLRGSYSALRGGGPVEQRLLLDDLSFAEPFRVDLSETALDLEEKHFIIPLDQCSKATLFNMGLIHYRWGCADLAMQFFDLASAISLQLSPLSFDPVILGAFNNMAQIHWQRGQTSISMELLQDALTRGKAALTALDSQHGTGDVTRCCRRLRRKLARTLLNIGHVHYINCCYDKAMIKCEDAHGLLDFRVNNTEMAAICHNMGVLSYHQGKKEAAVQYLEKFIEMGKQYAGPDSLQLAGAYALKGLAMFEMGRWQECMTPLTEALRIRQLKLHKYHPAIAESFCALGRVWLAREEYDFCHNAFRMGISIHREAAKANGNILSFEAAQALLDMGRTFHAQNKIEEAIGAYQEAMEWTSCFFGDSCPFVGRLLNILGNLYLELGQVDLAMKNFELEMGFCLKQGIPMDRCTMAVKDRLYRVTRHSFPAAAIA